MTRPGSQTATKRRGLVAASVVGLLLVAFVSFVVARQSRTIEPEIADPIDVPDPGKITHVPDRAGTDASITGTTEGLRIQVEARAEDGSTRLASEFIADRVEPLERQNYLLDRPEAWYYLEDGRIVHVRADSARVVMPDREREPQSGTLSGNVRVRFFEASPSAAGKLEGAEPTMLAEFEAVSFNSAEGSMYTSGPLHVVGQGIDLTGVGLTLIVDELRNRISFMEIRRDGKLRFSPIANPSREERTAAEVTRPQAQAPSTDAGTPTPPPRKPIITIYAASASGEVAIRHGSRVVGGEKLDGWIRLLDGELPENAIARIAFASPDKADPSTPAAPSAPSTSDASPAPAGATEGPSTIAGSSPDDIELSWSGPFVLQPLARKPEELEREHVAMRLHSPESGFVTFRDDGLGADGTCGSIAYGATTAQLELAGDAGHPTRFGSDDLGTLVSSALELDLGTGLGSIIGPGTFTKASLGTASWSEGGEFSLAVRGDRLSGSLKSITLLGDVGLLGESGEAYGQSLRAEFDAPGQGASVLSRAIITDEAYQATLAMGEDGELTGRVIDATFARRGERSIPRDLIVEGRARMRRGDATLSCERLDATLAENSEGKLVATWAKADRGARFTQGELLAEADTIVAFPEDQVVDLVGDGAFIASGPTRIDGSQIRLNGLTRELWVPAAGRFTHVGSTPDEPARIEAAWSEEMRFDHAAGVIECSGDAVARSFPTELDQDTVRGERVRIELEPASEGERADSTGNSFVLGPSSAGPSRRILRAAAYGSEDNGELASVESLSWSEPAKIGVERAAPWRVLFLQGPTILADSTESALVVDRAGRLVVSDQRPSDEPSEPSPAPLGGGRGASLFEWAGGLRFDRGPGVLKINDRVVLTHRRAADSMALVLRCNELEARIRQAADAEAGGPLASRSIDGELVSARALGGVALVMGGKELSAAELSYDAVRGLVVADSSDAPVILFDPARGTTVTAASLEWNLASDEIRVVRPFVPGAIPAPERPK